MIPSDIPAETACDCAAASCSSSCHCSQRWKSTAARCPATKSATPSAPGCRSDSGHSCQSPPYSSASAHQVAKSSSAAPSRAQNAAYASSRPAVRGTAKTSSKAARLAAHAVSRSIASSDAACFWTPSRSRRTRPRLRSCANSGNGLDPQIQRVDEAARRRQIRRRLHRCGGGGRVQRIDQDIPGAVNRRRPHRKVNEIGEVADTPGLAGPDAI